MLMKNSVSFMKMISLFSIGIMMVTGSITSCVSNVDNASKQKTSEEGLQEANDRVLTSTFTDLMSSFENASARSVGVIDMNYPDYYGGSYCENGKLVVLVVKGYELESVRKDLASRINTDAIELKQCDNSYKTLIEITNYLNSFFTKEENKKLLDELSIDGWGPANRENMVVVKTKNNTPQKMELFKNKVINSPLIIFKQSTGRIKLQETKATATAYIPGRKLVTNHRNTSASLGYPVKSSLYEGFLVSGHFANARSYSVKIGSITLGVCETTKCTGNVDAAFIKYSNSSSYIVSNTIAGISNNNIVLGASVDEVGSYGYVYLCGYYTKARGVVEDVGQSVINSNKDVISNCTQVWYETEPKEGDSGGICYSGSNNVVGLHVGVDDAGSGYYCLSKEIHSALSVERNSKK